MNSELNKSAMTNGLIIGALLSAKFIFNAIDTVAFKILALIISVTVILVLYRFAKQFRDTNLGGAISYGKAFNYLFQTYFYGAIILSITILVYVGFIQPDYLTRFVDELYKVYESMNITITEEIDSVIQTLFKPAPFALFSLMSNILSALFWSLIIAAIVKKEKSIFE